MPYGRNVRTPPLIISDALAELLADLNEQHHIYYQHTEYEILKPAKLRKPIKYIYFPRSDATEYIRLLAA